MILNLRINRKRMRNLNQVLEKVNLISYQIIIQVNRRLKNKGKIKILILNKNDKKMITIHLSHSHKLSNQPNYHHPDTTLQPSPSLNPSNSLRPPPSPQSPLCRPPPFPPCPKSPPCPPPPPPYPPLVQAYPRSIYPGRSPLSPTPRPQSRSPN